jgi:Pectate lyase superfamily protein/Ubiquitin-activating enzyme E1 FCCH domain
MTAPNRIQYIFGVYHPVTGQLLGVTPSGNTPYSSIAGNIGVTSTFAGVRLQSSATVQTVFATGKNSASDGGGGTFVFNSADTTTGAWVLGSVAGTVLTVTTVNNGTLAVGQSINRSDTGASIGTISSFGTGAGGTGTYNLSASATIAGPVIFTADNNSSILVGTDGARWYLSTAAPAQTYTDTGIVNALSITGAGLATALTAGLQVNVTAAFTCTGACTFNYNGLGVKALLNTDNSPINQGQISAGSTFQLYYTGTAWQLFGDNIQGPTIFETAAAATVTNGYFSPILYLDARRYGADPNGVADSTPAIQAAVNVALQNSQAGGIVFLQEGTFKVTATINIPGNVCILGCNKGATILYASNAFTQDQPILNYQGGSGTPFTITGITQAASAVVTINTVAVQNPVSIGQLIAFSSVNGMTQINGLKGTVTAIGGASGAWTFTVNINSSAFTAYTSAGSASGGGRISNIFLRDVQLQSSVPGVARGISAAWVIFSDFDNVSFYQLANGFVGNTCFTNKWTNKGSFQVAGDDIRFLAACNNNHFDKCRFTGVNGINVLGFNDTLKVTSGDFEGIVNTPYTITAITQAASAVVTVNQVSTVNPFLVGDVVSFSGVNGMTQINGLGGTVSAIGGSSGAWTFTININSSAFTAYSSAGTASQGGAGIRLAPVTGTVCYSVSVKTTHFENIQGYAIRCEGVDAGSVKGLEVENNYLTGGVSGYGNVTAISAIKLTNVYGFRLETNYINDWATNFCYTNSSEIFGRIANNVGTVTNLGSGGFRNQTLLENNQPGGRQVYLGSLNPVTSPIFGAQGDTVWATNPGVGGVFGYACTTAGNPGIWAPISVIQGFSADNGDANATLNFGVPTTQVWNTPLTSNRTVTLTAVTASANSGMGVKFRIVRTANATGASTLTVLTKALTAGQWVDVEWNQVTLAWVETGFGSL